MCDAMKNPDQDQEPKSGFIILMYYGSQINEIWNMIGYSRESCTIFNGDGEMGKKKGTWEKKERSRRECFNWGVNVIKTTNNMGCNKSTADIGARKESQIELAWGDTSYDELSKGCAAVG